MIIGLTGPTGAGKSLISNLFKKYDFALIDADEVSRQIVSKGSSCLKWLEVEFGSKILNPDKTLNRKILAKLAFENKENLKKLNNITHPYIINRIKNLLASYDKSDIKNIVIDAPLLFESYLDKLCDKTISVLADKNSRLQRIIKRDNISLDLAMLRISAQNEADYYINKADYTINTGCTLEELELKFKNLIKEINFWTNLK